ncbi:MAG: lysophospholipid acyltransferase family protein [Rhodothermales bacterium]
MTSRTRIHTGTCDDGPEPTLAARLHFAWFAFVAAMWTIPMAITQLITHQFQPTARNFKRNARVWGGVILRLSGLRVRVFDRAHLHGDAPCVFVSNHQNLLDILALSAALPYPFGFVAKAELSRVPFLGLAIRNSASVFIDRSDPRSAVRSLRKAGERIRAGNSVLLFVEGTRSYGRVLKPLKKGAFAIAVEAGVQMVPVTIQDAYKRMNEKQRLLRGGTIHIVVGEPIQLKGVRRRDLPELMDTTRARLESQLDPSFADDTA